MKDLLIEDIKLWPPPIKDMIDHRHKFLVFWGMQAEIKSCFTGSYALRAAKEL